MSNLGRPIGLLRRSLLAASSAIPAVPVMPRIVMAQTPPAPNAQQGMPASTITAPPRDWAPGRPSIYPDPDVIVIDPSFRALVAGNSPLRRVWTGADWAEGPAWSSQGRYLVFSA